MKKIVSALIVLTMLFAFANLSLAADIKSYDLTYKILNSSRVEIDDISELSVGDKFYVDFYMSSYPQNMTTFGAVLLYDTSAITYDNSKTSQQVVSEEEDEETGGMKNVTLKPSASIRAANDGLAVTVMGTDKWSTSEYPFDTAKYFLRLRFKVAADCTGKTIEVNTWNLSDGMGDGYVPNENPTITLMTAGGGEDEPEYGSLTPSEIDTTGNILATVKHGTALYSTFTTPVAGDLTFKWAVNIDDVRHYSKDIFSQPGLTEGQTVIVSASYDNADNAKVDNVDLIVKVGEKFYLTDDADWANK